MILLTTSRRPSRRLRTFCRDLARVIPNTMRTNRGKMSLEELAENAIEERANRVVIIERWKGGPGRMRLLKIDNGELVQVPPQIYIQGIRLQREFEKGEAAMKSLIIGKPKDELSDTVMLTEALSGFFEILVMNLDRAPSGYKATMQIQRDKTRKFSLSFLLLPNMTEIGPRLTVSHVVWDLK